MKLNVIRFFALFFVVLALVPAGAHVAELPHKLSLSAEDYRTVQQIYQGWSLFGIVIFGALFSTCALAVLVRRTPRTFMLTVVAFLCIACTQVVFWTLTFPVNQLTENWTILPPDWSTLRTQWEYSHAASAGLNLAAVIALILALMGSTKND